MSFLSIQLSDVSDKLSLKSVLGRRRLSAASVEPPSISKFYTVGGALVRKNFLLMVWWFFLDIVDSILGIIPFLVLFVAFLSLLGQAPGSLAGPLSLLVNIIDVFKNPWFWVSAGGLFLITQVIRWALSCFLRSGIYGVLKRICLSSEITSLHTRVFREAVEGFSTFVRYSLLEMVIRSGLWLMFFCVILGSMAVFDELGSTGNFVEIGIFSLGLSVSAAAAGIVAICLSFAIAEFQFNNTGVLYAFRSSLLFFASNLLSSIKIGLRFLSYAFPLFVLYIAFLVMFSVVEVDDTVLILISMLRWVIDVVFALLLIYLSLLFYTTTFLFYAYHTGKISNLPVYKIDRSQVNIKHTEQIKIFPLPRTTPFMTKLSHVLNSEVSTTENSSKPIADDQSEPPDPDDQESGTED